MKKIIALLTIAAMASCQDNAKKNQNTEVPVKAEQGVTIQEPSETKPVAEPKKEEGNIMGTWMVTDISGGPVTMYPSGKKAPGMKLDFNMIWKGAIFEFTRSVMFISVPGLTKEDIGNYEIKGNSLLFQNLKGDKQPTTFTRNGNQMTISFSPEMYRNLISKNGGSKIEMDIPSAIVFHLKKQ